jgi:hypothetical protein
MMRDVTVPLREPLTITLRYVPDGSIRMAVGFYFFGALPSVAFSELTLRVSTVQDRGRSPA